MDKFSFSSRGRRCRKRRDEFNNAIFDLLVNETPLEKKVFFLRLPVQKPDTKRFNFKKESNRLIHRLAAAGAFQSLSLREQKRAELCGKIPHGYEIEFIIPPTLGGAYSIDNMYVVPKDVHQLMYELYWRLLLPDLNRFLYIKDKHKVGIRMPDIPRFFSQKTFLDFVLPSERPAIEKFLARKKAWRTEAMKRVAVQNKRRHVILRQSFRKAPPPGMKYVLIPAKFPSVVARSKARLEYLQQRPTLIMESLKRGDLDFLPFSVRLQIEKTGQVPESLNLTFHHIIPRSIGGTNNIENMVWLDKEKHFKLHQEYISPVLEYLDFLVDDPRRVYCEIPVPNDTELPCYTATKKARIVPLRSLLKRGKGKG